MVAELFLRLPSRGASHPSAGPVGRMPHSFGYRARTRDLFSRKFRKAGTLAISKTYMPSVPSKEAAKKTGIKAPIEQIKRFPTQPKAGYFRDRRVP
ncbi:hypothetical protein FNF29_08492 [Cafeteria roenbergensis]|uniref:Uncharacterized protein n=1 Tax=Cafeteria roenbergensis TaxID=33653 RepID=A0A5A8C0T0_CAFRO|nr:hypothetical protein FNF29_08492 [Cafeteria roenbergensis]|eukprot:KAA0145541.1 hypothetical protein FNF29_08492 [Cafeteria roenbergensis]